MVEPESSVGPSPQPGTLIVRTALPCFGCRYDLRGAALEGRCPECGDEVRRTFEGGWLQFADVPWLRRVRLGIDSTIGMFALIFVLGTVSFFLLIVHVASSPNQPPDPTQLIPWLVYTPLALGALFLMLMGLVTVPEPMPNRPLPLRRGPLARWTVWLFVFALATVVATILLMDPSVDPPEEITGRMVAASILSTISNVAAAVSIFLLLVYLRRIARRNLEHGLSRLMSFVTWGYVAVSSLEVLFVSGMTVWSLAGGLQSWAAMASSMPTTQPATFTWGVTARGIVTTSASGGQSLPAASGPVATNPANIGLSPAAPFGPGIPPPMPMMPFMFMIVPTCVGECSLFVLLIAAVVAVFWFRRMLSRAIEHHTTIEHVVSGI